MKKITILMVFMLLLASCSKNAESYKSYDTGINIFDNKSDLMSDYVPDNKIILNNIAEKYKKAALIYESGLIEHVSINNSEIKDINDVKDIKGIYLYENYHSITDAYYFTKEFMDKGEKVLTVLLDGFSLGQYNYAVENNYISFLNNYYNNEALSVYTPVTNAGYAAILTGQTPDKNGVHDRSFREMKVDSVFKYAIENNKDSILLEGDIKILNTEIEPRLHIDINKDGDTDDEMFNSAMAAASEVSEDYDFIFIHFHGIDDRGHSYGPYSNEAMDYIKKIDSYIEQISLNWDGKIILTADHGMHETKEGGNHGECRAQDMIVPFFIIQ